MLNYQRVFTLVPELTLVAELTHRCAFSEGASTELATSCQFQLL